MSLDFTDLLDLSHNLPGWRYKWTCVICLIIAKAGILLEFQLSTFTIICLCILTLTRALGFGAGGAGISSI